MIDWTQTALLFPGQGSQVLGMGQDIAAAHPIAAETFQQADDILGFALSDLCWNGPAEDLNDTFNTQPALFVTSIATLRALEALLGTKINPTIMAGHSLGEITALAAASAISFEDGLRLVRERGRLMKQAGDEQPGAMAAILGPSADVINTICQQASEETGKIVVLANDNCPGQIVISGDEAAIERGLALASEHGAKRAIKLAVSIASHSPLMKGVAADLATVLASVTMQSPAIPVIGNVGAGPIEDNADAIRDELTAQLTSTVRWTESMHYALAQNITTFVEVGSKDVLSGLMRRINRKSIRFTLNTADALVAFVDTVNT